MRNSAHFVLAVMLSIVHLLNAPSAFAKPENKSATSDSKQIYKRKIKYLKPDEIEKILNERVSGQLGSTFGQFANMYMVMSNIELGVSLGLCCDNNQMSMTPLEPAFPSTYKPTVREFLDAVAAQTNSQWVYEEKYQFANTIIEPKKSDKDIDGMVIFQFLAVDKQFPFEMTPAKGWEAKRRTNWIMYVPPIAPLAMDQHVLGTLSSDVASEQAALIESAPIDSALDSWKRANQNASAKDLQKTKVGVYDAYFFEQKLPPDGEEKVHWRQWHFMVGNRLCYIISTVPKQIDSQLFPDIESMLKTFRPTDTP